MNCEKACNMEIKDDGEGKHWCGTIPVFENAAQLSNRSCQAGNNLFLPSVHCPTKSTYPCAHLCPKKQDTTSESTAAKNGPGKVF
jgi:hypothetical protein